MSNRNDGLDSKSSEVLSAGKTADEWVEIFRVSHGVSISPRRLKNIARRENLYCSFTRPMMLLPKHVDQILEVKPSCRLSSTNGTKFGGSEEKSMNSRTPNIIAKARAKLQSQTPKST
jgi:hypothetical protein